MYKYVLSFLLYCLSFLAIGAEFVEGKDYQILEGTQLAHKKGAIRVTEFFSYGCPWCYRLDAPLYAWISKQGKSIQFSKIPVVFNSSWENYAKAYYIIESLSLGKTVSDSLFKTIIVDKQSLTSRQSMVDFFIKNGVEADLVDNALSNSPSMDLKLKADEALMAKYQINAIPTLVVNHHFKTNLQMAKTEDRLFQILDYLVKEAK